MGGVGKGIAYLDPFLEGHWLVRGLPVMRAWRQQKGLKIMFSGPNLGELSFWVTYMCWGNHMFPGTYL